MRHTDRLKDPDGLRFEVIPIEQIDLLFAEVVHRLRTQIIMSLVVAGLYRGLGVALLEDSNAAHEVQSREVEIMGAIEAGQDHPCVDTLQEEMSVTEARRREHEEIQGRRLGVQAVRDRQLH